jgi:hypothetical protein
MKSGIDHERLVRMTADLEEDEYGLSLRLRVAGGLSNYGGDNFGFRRSVLADRVEGGSGFHQMFLNIQYSCSRDEFRNLGMPEDTRNFCKPPSESISSMMIDEKLAKYYGTGRLPDDGCRRRAGERSGPPAGETYSQISPPGDLCLH